MENINIKNRLQELLNRIPDFFEPDELAYYSAHCKNEQQIRDKIAWQLHLSITQDKNMGIGLLYAGSGLRTDIASAE